MGVEVSAAHYTNMEGTEAKKGSGFVMFHEVIDEDKVASAKEGRPIARSRIFVKKMTPGDTLLEVDKPMKQDDPLKYPREWAAFQSKRSQVVEGTALEMWPQISTKEVFEFKAANIFTVEQLINLPDQFASKIMGFHILKKKAMDFLRLAKDATLFEAKEKENAELKSQVEELSRQVRELTSLVHTQPAQRRGGRPKGSKPKDRPLSEPIST
jgi:hypothetical protein